MTKQHARIVLDHPSLPQPLGWAEKEEMFTLRDYSQAESVPESAVWVRGDYDKSTRKYLCHKWDDVNHSVQMASSKPVYFYFTF